MVTAAEVTTGLAAAEAIVSAIVKVAPAIEQGVVSSIPLRSGHRRPDTRQHRNRRRDRCGADPDQRRGRRVPESAAA
jgi:hypothetical protein